MPKLKGDPSQFKCSNNSFQASGLRISLCNLDMTLGFSSIPASAWLDGAAAEGRTRTNNDFARGYEALDTGCTSKDESISCLGTFHLLPIKLQELLVVEANQIRRG